jgi:hypothetical protein
MNKPAQVFDIARFFILHAFLYVSTLIEVFQT